MRGELDWIGLYSLSKTGDRLVDLPLLQEYIRNEVVEHGIVLTSFHAIFENFYGLSVLHLLNVI